MTRLRSSSRGRARARLAPLRVREHRRRACSRYAHHLPRILMTRSPAVSAPAAVLRRALLAAAAVTTFAGRADAQRPLKVYISADMEGIAGVVSGDQLGPAGFEY